MTDRMQQNVLKYATWAAISVAIAVLTALLTQLNGTEDIAWRPIIAAGASATLGVLTMAFRSAYLTRVGSEEIAAKVDLLREDGVHRKDMVVLPQNEVAAMAAEIQPVHPSMTPGETDQLLTLVRNVGPQRAIVVLQDALYREPERRP
jgi:hypothetical protein